MKYIIMAGRSLTNTELPKHLWKVGNETIIGRTIRLLKECGVSDIAISTHDERFKVFGLPLLEHENPPKTKYFISAFYSTDEPTCYVFGDVVFSLEAVRKIVETETDSVEFFASAPPFSKDYPKKWAEPFAFKVVDTQYFKECIDVVKKGIQNGVWRRDPIAWELWQVIKKTPINKIDYTNYTIINDYTCDVDELQDLDYYKDKFEETKYMIHTCPKRLWYVEQFLLPSMLKQCIKKEQITVYNDEKQEGNLRACINSFLTLPEEGGTWHLQDDVIICRDFKERTEKHNSGFIAGFISQRYDLATHCGIVPVKQMAWTFPCIRIPNKIARECAEWISTQIIGNPVYRNKWKDGNGDDWCFKAYVSDYYKDSKCQNLKPSLVDHIDWLIGGSAVGTQRDEPTRAKYFEDLDLVEELRKELCKKEKLNAG